MSTPLLDRIRTDASNYAPLSALLGASASSFRWYADQLVQGSQFPAIAVMQVSNPKTYVTTGRLRPSWYRLQFTIWGGQFATGAQAREDVETALLSFLDQWSGGIGIPNLSQYPNFLIGARDGLFPQTDGPIYQRLLDASIFSNDSL